MLTNSNMLIFLKEVLRLIILRLVPFKSKIFIKITTIKNFIFHTLPISYRSTRWCYKNFLIDNCLNF